MGHLLEPFGDVDLTRCATRQPPGSDVPQGSELHDRQKLNAGADVNHEEEADNNDTPLEAAISLDSADMVTLLLEFDANPNLQSASHNGGRNTVLSVAHAARKIRTSA